MIHIANLARRLQLNIGPAATGYVTCINMGEPQTSRTPQPSDDITYFPNTPYVIAELGRPPSAFKVFTTFYNSRLRGARLLAENAEST